MEQDEAFLEEGGEKLLKMATQEVEFLQSHKIYEVGRNVFSRR